MHRFVFRAAGSRVERNWCLSYSLSSLKWILVGVPFILFVLIFITNIFSHGLGSGFDDLSYICLFRDIWIKNDVVSPFTTPKVFPTVLLGSIYMISGSFEVIASIQGIIGILLLIEVYQLGLNIGLTRFFALAGVGIFVMYHLVDISVGNAVIFATLFFLIGMRIVQKPDSWRSGLALVCFTCAFLSRPEPAVAGGVYAVWLLSFYSRDPEY